MTTILTDGAPETDHGDGGHRPSAAAAWTDEQIAYADFLKNACGRLKVIAVDIGVEPDLVDDFVRDALVIIHRARHTQARGRQGKAWIEAIAHNLGRKRRCGAAVRGRRRSIFRSLVHSLEIIGLKEVRPSPNGCASATLRHAFKARTSS